MEGEARWEMTISDEDSSSDESDVGDVVDAGNAIPRLLIRTPCLVGPAHLVTLTEEIHQRLIIAQNLLSSGFQECTYLGPTHLGSYEQRAHQFQDCFRAITPSLTGRRLPP